MLSFILASLANILPTLIVLFVLAVIVALIVIYIVRTKKKGGSCQGGCVGCPMAGKCNDDINIDNKKK